jgi:shikimate dehydrogenase
MAFSVCPNDLEDALRGLAALRAVGTNITIPHKVAAVGVMDELSAEARGLGAVNTVCFRGDAMVGHNTDVEGFAAAAQSGGYQLRGSTGVVYGAGGAARAVVCSMLAHAMDVTVVNRTPERAEKMSAEVLDRMGMIAGAKVARAGSEEERDAVRQAEIVVNATSAGMAPNDDATPPVPVDCLRKRATVMDLVYRPRETRLLAAARAAGCSTIDGVSMLVHQGAASFRLWFGQEPDTGRMREAVETALAADPG